MPPPPRNPLKRMTAQSARPVARYRPGKPTAEEESSEEDESEPEQQQRTQSQRKPASARQAPRPTAQATQEDEEDDDEGFVTDPEDEEDGGVQIPTTKPKPPTSQSLPPSNLAPTPDAAQEEEGSESESDETSASESASDSSQSEDEPQRKFQRPTFIKKSHRNAPTSAETNAPTSTSPQPADPSRRLAETETLIADRIQRDALARAAGKKHWDDDDVQAEDEIDDTDGLDPAAEHAAWRLRELIRLKRDREAMIAREAEIEELERRRNLSAAEREKEDAEFLDQQKEDRDGRGESGFLARYHHKGAFFQDSEAAEILKRRDVMGARFVDDVADKSALPEYMRVRDMTKLGKKGRTRYTDLRNEDTGRWGDDVKRWKGAGDIRPRDHDGRGTDGRLHDGGPTASGANASALGDRRKDPSTRSRDKSPTSKARRSYSRSRSRSRSPARRKRGPSPRRPRDSDDGDDDERSKRRRLVDAT